MTTVTFADWLAGEAHWAGWARADVHALVVRLFDKEGVNLVRLARFFVDDGDAAEDLVQEAFIRLARPSTGSRIPTGFPPTSGPSSSTSPGTTTGGGSFPSATGCG